MRASAVLGALLLSLHPALAHGEAIEGTATLELNSPKAKAAYDAALGNESGDLGTHLVEMEGVARAYPYSWFGLRARMEVAAALLSYGDSRATRDAFAVLAGKRPKVKGAPPLPLLWVPAGVYALEGREFGTQGFVIMSRPLAGDAEGNPPHGCLAPLPDEWLIAAKNEALIVVKAYEHLAAPGERGCTFSEEELEAEGVVGSYYFAGIGTSTKGEFNFLEGGKDPRTSISEMGVAPFEFWDPGLRPKPRVHRCVVRVGSGPATQYVQSSTLNLRAGRGVKFKIIEKLPIGAELEVLHQDGEWAYVRWHDKSKFGDCKRSGFVPTRFVAFDKPDGKKLLEEARAFTEHGLYDKAVAALERACALAPDDLKLLGELAQTYDKASQPEDAKRVRKLIEMKRKKGKR